MLRTLLACVLLAPLAVADENKELKALTGTWVVEKMELEGTDAISTFKDVTLVIDGDRYTATIGDMTDKGMLSVDSAKKPKTMDIKGTEGVNKGRTYLCIYELKDGKLTICYSLDEAKRPERFETSKDSKTMLAVYRKK